jgi:hypothetical protein
MLSPLPFFFDSEAASSHSTPKSPKLPIDKQTSRPWKSYDSAPSDSPRAQKSSVSWPRDVALAGHYFPRLTNTMSCRLQPSDSIPKDLALSPSKPPFLDEGGLPRAQRQLSRTWRQGWRCRWAKVSGQPQRRGHRHRSLQAKRCRAAKRRAQRAAHRHK